MKAPFCESYGTIWEKQQRPFKRDGLAIFNDPQAPLLPMCCAMVSPSMQKSQKLCTKWGDVSSIDVGAVGCTGRRRRARQWAARKLQTRGTSTHCFSASLDGRLNLTVIPAVCYMYRTEAATAASGASQASHASHALALVGTLCRCNGWWPVLLL